MTACDRRDLLKGALMTGAAVALPSFADVGRRPVKFLVMTDHHVESDFMENGHAAYAMWKVGNHAALERTYEFISRDPYCRDVDFALFCGDQLNTGYAWERNRLEEERANYYRTLESLDLYRNSKGCDVSYMGTGTSSGRYSTPAGRTGSATTGSASSPLRKSMGATSSFTGTSTIRNIP